MTQITVHIDDFVSEITVHTSDLVTLTEAGRLLGVNRLTIWRWIKEGKIASLRIGGRPFISRKQIEIIKERREELKWKNYQAKELKN